LAALLDAFYHLLPNAMDFTAKRPRKSQISALAFSLMGYVGAKSQNMLLQSEPKAVLAAILD